MLPRALPEEELRRFLRRRRRGSGLIEPPPLGSFLAQTLDLVSRLVPCEAGSLLLDDPLRPRRRSPLTFVAAFGPAADRLVGIEVPRGRGIVGHVYRTATTYSAGEARKDRLFFGRVDELAAFRTRSLVAAPLRLEQAVCGVLELVNRHGARRFSARDVELVELFSQYISRAILNAVDVLKHNELLLFDELTGVRNVRGLEPAIDKELRRADTEGSDVSVLFLDVDRLKRINDSLGHRAGSEALRRVGRVLDASLGDRGTAFRFGGDEFVAVCPQSTAREARAIAEALLQDVRRLTPGELEGGGILPSVSVSIGVASSARSLRRGTSGPPSRASRLLAAADRALYRAKRTGRARVAVATTRDDVLRATPARRPR